MSNKLIILVTIVIMDLKFWKRLFLTVGTLYVSISPIYTPSQQSAQAISLISCLAPSGWYWFTNPQFTSFGELPHNQFQSFTVTSPEKVCHDIIIWLVAYLLPTPLKKHGVKVSWDDDIPNWMESHNPFHGSSHHQPVYIYPILSHLYKYIDMGSSGNTVSPLEGLSRGYASEVCFGVCFGGMLRGLLRVNFITWNLLHI